MSTKKEFWIKNWSGNWCMCFCSFYGYFYTKGLKKFFGKSFKKFFVQFERGVGANYLLSDLLSEMGRYFAKLISQDHFLAKKWSNGVIRQVDKINLLTSHLRKKKIISAVEYEKLRDLIYDLTPRSFAIKRVIDYLPAKLQKKFLPDFEHVRVYMENVFEDTDDILKKILTSISKKTGYSFNFLCTLTHGELENYFQVGKLPKKQDLNLRYRGMAVFYTDGKEKIIVGQEFKKLKNAIMKTLAIREIKGTSAYSGIVRGRARIILNPTKVKTFNQGDILVAGMTRPDYLGLIKKSSAFVTDAGGMLSHAAIVARELKKPCIVGTEIATKVLKNGDLVEVDANKGVVKKNKKYMSTDYTRKKIDWEVYIERRNPILYISNSTVAYGRLCREITGFGLRYRLHYIKNGGNIFYRSKKEYERGKKYFLTLTKKNPRKVQALIKRCRSYVKREKNLVSLFSRAVKNDYVEKNYKKITEEMQNIFVHLTVIPWMFLDALDAVSEKQKKSKLIARTIKAFFPFRKTSRNILQTTVLERIYRSAAEICSHSDYLDFSFLTSNELGECLEKKKYLFKSDVEKRKKGCVFYEDEATGKLIFDYRKNFLQRVGIKKVSAKDYDKNKEIRGVIASPGIARGRVCVINKPNEMSKCQGDYIIVSISTKPALMPALIKCKGIVTDEGGLSCHASIISRELKKPCIIGTKIATKVFKDGDLVEVDANIGIVKRLK